MPRLTNVGVYLELVIHNEPGAGSVDLARPNVPTKGEALMPRRSTTSSDGRCAFVWELGGFPA